MCFVGMALHSCSICRVEVCLLRYEIAAYSLLGMLAAVSTEALSTRLLML